jgi:hypothetical protein
MATLVLRKHTVLFDSNTHALVADFEKGERFMNKERYVIDSNCQYVLLKGYRKTP